MEGERGRDGDGDGVGTGVMAVCVGGRAEGACDGAGEENRADDDDDEVGWMMASFVSCMGVVVSLLLSSPSLVDFPMISRLLSFFFLSSGLMTLMIDSTLFPISFGILLLRK